MALNMSNMQQPSGNTLGYPAVGVHAARLIGVVDLGVHDRPVIQGQQKTPCGQISLTFELTDDFVDIDGVKKPRWISKKENAFSSERANLTAIVAKLDPAGKFGGDLAAMARAAVPCLVTVSQKTDAQTKQAIEGVRVSDIGGVPNGFPVAAAQNEPLVFDWDAPDMVAYARLPNWVHTTFKKAHNYAGSKVKPLIEQFEAAQAQQQGQNQAQATSGGVPAPQTSAPAQSPAQAQNVSQAAPAAGRPAAPPGYYWDDDSNSFKEGTGPATVAAQEAPAKLQVTIPQGYPPGWCIGPDNVPVAFDAATMEVVKQAPQQVQVGVGNQAAPAPAKPY